ncbi:hypothetical protein BAZOLSSOX_1328 [uncultured Gammaproteobacteria bacterium]|nr:hypothetical protein BAZOLSSOX_1328 [uncultured Gammaproteobacteria bacterium]
MFLSHLCGGESTSSTSPQGHLFLSHLCGGEFNGVFTTKANDFSKPPVWW